MSVLLRVSDLEVAYGPVRAVKGVGLEVLWRQGLPLVALAALAIGATVAAFRKEVA